MFNLNDAKRMLMDAIKEKGGNYIDLNSSGSCTYVKRDPVNGYQPSCIVGTGLSVTHGIDPVWMHNNIESMNGAAAIKFSLYGNDENGSNYTAEVMTEAARAFIDKAQEKQDSGYSWADAYRSATRYVNDYSFDFDY